MSTRPTAMNESITPSTIPIPISRTAIRHQSWSLISPKARPRMTRVDDWEPELPPAEIKSGT